MHLRRFRIGKGTVVLPRGGWEPFPPLPAPAFCAPHRGDWGPLGLLLLGHPGPMGVGVGGDRAEDVRSPCVIANSKEGRRWKSWR